MCEFVYNNSYQSSIGMAPFEALYECRCMTLVCWEEVGVRSFHGPSVVGDSSEKGKDDLDEVEGVPQLSEELCR